MKAKVAVLALTLALISWLGSSQAQAVSTPQYMGQTTWTVSITQRESGPVNPPQTFPVTGGITKLGDTFYLFQGYVTQTGGDNPFFLSGAGTVINNQLIMTLNTSQRHVTDPQDQSVWRDTGVMQVTLNTTAGPTYLNGSLYEIGHDYNAAGGPTAFDQRYTAGDLTRTGPAIPLNISGTGALSLLLQ